MLEKHLVHEIEAIRVRDGCELPSILIQGSASDTQDYKKALEEKDFNFTLAHNVKAFQEALSAAQSPLVVVILQPHISPSIAGPLASACDRLEVIYIIRIDASVCINPYTSELGVRIEYNHPIVSESPAAIRAAEKTRRAFPTEAFMQFLELTICSINSEE